MTINLRKRDLRQVPGVETFVGMNRRLFFILMPVLGVGIGCPGCVIYRHPTQEIQGTVIDADTKKPIGGCVVQNQEDIWTSCKTSGDGRFDLPASHVWRIYYLVAVIPWDGDVTSLVIKSHDYRTIEPYVIAYPVEFPGNRNLHIGNGPLGRLNQYFTTTYETNHAIIVDSPIEMESSKRPAKSSTHVFMLVTKNYELTITIDCKEGKVENDCALFHCISKGTGKIVDLKGSALYHRDVNGAPPQFVGYRFTDGVVKYDVFDEGFLIITGGAFVREEGEWRDLSPK